MKILQLTKKFPFPLKDGESIAVDSLSKALVEQGCEIHLLAMNTTKHYVEVADIRSLIPQYTSVTTSNVNNSIKIIDALANLFSSQSYHISRFDYQDFRDKLADLLLSTKFDMVLMESIYLAPYIDDIRAVANMPVVMRAHNVEHEIWDRVADQTDSLLKRRYLKLLVNRLRTYELAQLSKIDGLIAFTQRDLQFFEQHGFSNSGLVAPIGIPTEKYSAKDKKGPLSIGFIGSLDWMPNIEGLQWFISKVWPLVLGHYPEVKLHIAGRNPNKSILDMTSQSVIVHGEVPDAKEFVASHAISIVPLLSGGGMRVKILEAMALSRAIVSTKVGAEGIDSDSIQIADDPRAFADALLHLLDDPTLVEALGKRARTDVVAKYDSVDNVKAVYNYLKTLQ